MEALTLKDLKEIKQERGYDPRILILVNDDAHIGEIVQTEMFDNLSRYRQYCEVIFVCTVEPMKGMRPVEVIIPSQLKKNPEADAMIGYLPTFCRGLQRIPVLFLNDDYTVNHTSDNVNAMVDFFCDR